MDENNLSRNQYSYWGNLKRPWWRRDCFIKKLCFIDGALDLYRQGSYEATWITGWLEYGDGEWREKWEQQSWGLGQREGMSLLHQHVCEHRESTILKSYWFSKSNYIYMGLSIFYLFEMTSFIFRGSINDLLHGKDFWMICQYSICLIQTK